MTCTPFTGAGPAAPSLDQMLARQDRRQIRASARCRSASRRSRSAEHAEEHELGRVRTGRCRRRRFRTGCSTACSAPRTGLDQPQDGASSTRSGKDAAVLRKGLPKGRRAARWTSIFRPFATWSAPIASLPPDYQKVTAPDEDFDMKDWPRIAKLQSDLLAYALATGQTRVASYMLTKCQGLARFPWLGHTAARHHDYTHKDGKAPGDEGRGGPAHSARHLPLARRRVRVPGRQAEVDSAKATARCWTTPC